MDSVSGAPCMLTGSLNYILTSYFQDYGEESPALDVVKGYVEALTSA